MDKIKNNLITEKEQLLTEIKKIAIFVNGDFEAKETNSNTDEVLDNADQGAEQANLINNRAILVELETRLNNIDDALTRVESGVYGECTKCGEDISEKRLLANQAAALCMKCSGIDLD